MTGDAHQLVTEPPADAGGSPPSVHADIRAIIDGLKADYPTDADRIERVFQAVYQGTPEEVVAVLDEVRAAHIERHQAPAPAPEPPGQYDCTPRCRHCPHCSRCGGSMFDAGPYTCICSDDPDDQPDQDDE